jgi:hypothetical protein
MLTISGGHEVLRNTARGGVLTVSSGAAASGRKSTAGAVGSVVALGGGSGGTNDGSLSQVHPDVANAIQARVRRRDAVTTLVPQRPR